MPAEIEWTLQGLFAWVADHPDSVRQELVVRDVKKAQRSAVSAWVTNRRLGLAARFSPQAYSRLRLTPRSAEYRRRKAKFYGGRLLPYRSPRRRVHTAELVVVPKTGWRLVSPRTTGAVTTRLKLPGARRLNLIDAVYRREFLGWGRNDRRSPLWLNGRTGREALDLIGRRVTRARRRQIGRKGV